MVLAALIVCTEYRHRTIGTTFMVTPRRSLVLLAKLVVGGGVAFAAGLVAVVASAVTLRLVGGAAASTVDLHRRPRPAST